ncbi:MAG: DsbA family protein [Holosporales bacterium]|jgi:protein-disulfide isomerase|nr:DsbA family protein [Holosporales bacterium]
MQSVKSLLCSSILAFFVGCNNNENGKNESQKSEISEQRIVEVVRKMLAEHPEDFVTAIDAGVQKRQQEVITKIEQNATSNQSKLFNAKLVIGDSKAPVKLALFFDPLEPVSKKFISEVMMPIAKERNDVAFFLVPVSVYGEQEGNASAPTSLLAAKATIAASFQNSQKAVDFLLKFPDIRDHTALTTTRVLQFAKEAGLDSEKLKSDIENESMQQELIAHGRIAIDIGIPLQMPVIFISTNKGLEMIPAFIKDKMDLVVDAVKANRPWQDALNNQEVSPKPTEPEGAKK